MAGRPQRPGIHEHEIATDAQAANNAGLTGTPSFLIGKTGGALKKFEYSSLTDPTGFERSDRKAAQGLARAMSARTLSITLIVLTVIGIGAGHLPDLHPLRGHQAAVRAKRRHLRERADLASTRNSRACRSR